MKMNYGKCIVEDCSKWKQHKGGKYCAMHLARVIRNGSIYTQKEMGIRYNTKLGKLTSEQLQYIMFCPFYMHDRVIAANLKVPLHLARYARRKLKGLKYKGKNKRTYLKSKFRAMKNNTCEICGWNEGPCDIHHILPLAQGGKDCFDNFICLCPNHHRTYHYKITQNPARDIF